MDRAKSIYYAKFQSDWLLSCEINSELYGAGYGSVLFKIDKAKRCPYSMFDVGRSMFDVQIITVAA